MNELKETDNAISFPWTDRQTDRQTNRIKIYDRAIDLLVKLSLAKTTVDESPNWGFFKGIHCKRTFFTSTFPFYSAHEEFKTTPFE